MEKIVVAVKRFYKANKIAPQQFACKHYAQCRQGCRKFTQAREPFIGSEYNKRKLPKLLFISSNPPSGDKRPQDRTVQAARRSESKFDHRKLPRPLHWYRTHEFAFELLKGFGIDLEIDDACRFFAHTNSAKCTTNDPHGREGAERLFRNCEEYLRGEVEAFCPNIIVTQGRMAQRGVAKAFEKFEDRHSTTLPCGYRILSIRNRQVLWIHTTHPRNFGEFNRERREYWGYWARVVRNSFRIDFVGLKSPTRAEQ